MRICFLGDGQHVNTVSWINHLAGVLGHEIHLITFTSMNTFKGNMKVYVLKAKSKTFLRYLLHIPKIQRLLSDIKPDFLIGYRITSYGFMAAATGFRPLILAAQGQNIAYDSSRVKAYFARYAIRRADLIHSWGDHMTKKLIDFGADPQKILTLPRGIDTNLFGPAPRRCFHPQSHAAYGIITTRGLNPDYNFEQILRALSVLKTSLSSFKYSIAGEGPYKSVLLRKIKDLGLEDFVEFVGKVRHHELPGYLQSADVYVSMVVSDGVSASLLEAMACGVFPIVTNNAANQLWIEDGENGFLVEFGDHKDLAGKIKYALENRELREKAVEINRVIVLGRASVENNMKTFENAWKKLIPRHDH
jgi:glycosyltransferase involved in cell wall biosynthesis